MEISISDNGGTPEEDAFDKNAKRKRARCVWNF